MKTYKIRFQESGTTLVSSRICQANNEDEAFTKWMHIYEACKIDGEPVSLISIEEVES